MFARSRSKSEAQQGARGGVLCAVREGGARAEWVLAAIRELQEDSSERIGVWLEAEESEEWVADRPAIFQGEVWDKSGDPVPRGWLRLSAESPLPMELFRSGKSVEFGRELNNGYQFLGPMAGLQRGLWVPIVVRRVVRGLILLGGGGWRGSFPEKRARGVAAQLELLLASCEDRREVSERRADLMLWRGVQESLRTGRNMGTVLRELAASCAADRPQGVGAGFAIIAERLGNLPRHGGAAARGEERLRIRAQGGEESWVHSLKGGPLEKFWKDALATGQIVGAAWEGPPLARGIGRMVAIPFFGNDGPLGVLLAGVSKGRAALGVLERLENRALLAAQVVEAERGVYEIAAGEAWARTQLEANGDSLVFVDSHGFVAEMTLGARKLTMTAICLEHLAEHELRFAELFQPRSREEVHLWLSRRSEKRAHKPGDFLKATLMNGEDVGLEWVNLSTRDFYAVRLTDRKAQEYSRTPQEAELELQQTLAWLEEGVVVFDGQGRIRAQNARFLQMMGLTEEEGAEIHTNEELMRMAAKNAVHADHFVARWKQLAQAEAEELHDEVSMAWPVPQVIERYMRPIKTKEGEQLGRVEVYREMTAQRAFQARMLQTEKLVALGQRVLGIVHELSNPLTTILGTAQRMVSKGEVQGSDGEAHKILEESQRAATILRQLLQLTRETREEKRLVSLNDLVARTVDLQRATLSAAGIRIKVEAGAALPLVQGDFGQLQQVLLNLLQNAQQAMEHGSGGTTITVRTKLGSAGRVRLEVADQGPGVPKAIQARIFDPFFTTKPAEEGTGLGLAIVLGFVRQHGGTVTIGSPPMGGAEFVVELPGAEETRRVLPEVDRVDVTRGGRGAAEAGLALAEEAKDNFAAKGIGVAGRGERQSRPERVLVVEDEPTVANLIRDVLRDEGMQVDVLSDGESALQQSGGEVYDLVICDLHLPGMDGQRFYNALLQRQDLLRDRMLFVTGDVLSPRTQEFLQRHRLPHLAKPFLVEELLCAVRERWRALNGAPLARKGAAIDHVAGKR